MQKETLVNRKPKLEGVTKDELPFPADVIVEVTSYCNLRCIICPYPTLKRPKGDMSFEVFKKIVDEIAREDPSAGLWVAIMGEPLIRGEGLLQMLSYPKEKKHPN